MNKASDKQAAGLPPRLSTQGGAAGQRQFGRVKGMFDSPVTQNVLIIDDDPKVAGVLLKLLAGKGIRGTVARERKSGLKFIEDGNWDLVFLGQVAGQPADLMARANLKVLREIRANQPELPVIMLSEKDSVSLAVNAVRAGCADFVVKPLEESVIERLLETFLPNHNVVTLASAQENMRCLYQIVGGSTKLAETVALARKVAPTSVAVLITGESGTGKELLAYLVHKESRRADGPYIRINCTALSDSLLESELFGHEKGAFTGAYTQRKGRFEGAHVGTLLLDEITETGPRFQGQLLRVLEQQDFERVGGNENIQVNIRVISTTNKDILAEVHRGRFRTDLYYRLAGVRLIVPPLRERKEDLRALVWHFVNQLAGESQRRITKLDPVMIEIFNKYDWPGNIRQLRNVVRTSLILGSGETLSLADVSWLLDELQPRRQEDLAVCERENEAFCSDRQSRGEIWASGPEGGCEIGRRWGPVSLEPGTQRANLPASEATGNLWPGLAGVKLQEIEQHAILATLRRFPSNQAKAAKALGISDRTLREKISKYRERGCLQVSK